MLYVVVNYSSTSYTVDVSNGKCTRHIAVHFQHLIRTLKFDSYRQGRSQEIRVPMLFSFKPAVCCCVYFNSREQILPVRGPIDPIGLRLILSILSISTCCVTRFLFDWSEASALFCLNHIRYDKQYIQQLTRVNPIWFDNYILRCGMTHIFRLIGLNPT